MSSIPLEDEGVERERLGRLFVIADEAITAGFDVLPAAVWLKPDGTLGKAPLLVSGHLGAHRDRQLIREQLIDPPHKPPSVPEGSEVVVGMVPGSGGCGVLDCDAKLGKLGLESLRALVAQHGDFVGAAWRSPSRGTNVVFRKPTGASYGNHSSWPGIDVRSDNGWVVAPGCTTPWGSWVWARGGYTTATPLPAALTDQLTAPTRAGRKASNAETVGFIEASPTESTPDAAVAFQREMVRFRSSGVGSRHDALVRIVAWAFGMHALDLRSAIDEIKAEWQHLTAGEGREDEVSDIACWVAGKEIDQRQEAAMTAVTDQVWEAPVQLRVQPRLPTFPDEKLPSWLGAFTRTVARATQTPIDLSGVMALASVGVAVGGRAIVEVRPGWGEPLNVWTVANLPPGARKSAVVAFFSRPFFAYQRDVRDKVRLEIIEKQTLKRAAEASLSKLIREQDKPEGKGTPIDEVTKEKRNTAIQAAARLVEDIEIPGYPRLLADDATPEALASLMAEQKGRIGVLSPEGDIFDIMAGRYSGEPNLGIYLRGHSGDTYQLDRKGRAPEFIERPALTLGLAVQPSVLREIGQRKNFRGRGLLARFLYSMPEDLVGRRDSDAPPMDPIVTRTYDEKMAALIGALAGWDDPMRLTLTPAAGQIITACLARLELRLHPDADLGSFAVLREWASKLVGQSARIAGLFHVADHMGEAHRHPIDTGTVEAAIALAEHYCIPHARAAFDLMGQDESVADAEAVLAWVIRGQFATFTKREVHAHHRARFPRATDLDGPLALLENYGWIAPVANQPRQGPGRKPSPMFQVNPLSTHSTESTE